MSYQKPTIQLPQADRDDTFVAVMDAIKYANFIFDDVCETYEYYSRADYEEH